MINEIYFGPYLRPILTVVVIIALAYILFRFRAAKNPKDDSLDIIEKRYEQGEITKADYDEAKRRRGEK